jgi:hypothetical protein
MMSLSHNCTIILLLCSVQLWQVGLLACQQCGGSGMFIPDPGSWILPIPDPGSQIPDPKTATKDRGGKKFFVKPFFVATNFTKLNIILFLICWRKKFGPIFHELLKFLPKKLSPSPQKYGLGIRDPGSGKNLFRIPDPGSRGQKGTGSGSATLPVNQQESATLVIALFLVDVLKINVSGQILDCMVPSLLICLSIHSIL